MVSMEKKQYIEKKTHAHIMHKKGKLSMGLATSSHATTFTTESTYNKNVKFLTQLCSLLLKSQPSVDPPTFVHLML
jgi:hypothetical protein